MAQPSRESRAAAGISRRCWLMAGLAIPLFRARAASNLTATYDGDNLYPLAPSLHFLTGKVLDRLRDWPKRFRHVGDVRGLGLMIGFELVHDQTTKDRAPELRDRIQDLAFERGLLVLGAGRNTIRLCPPLIITRDQADFAIDILEATLEECQRQVA